MKRILFATDFSDSCQNALKYVTQMVRGHDTKVDIIHVFDIPVSILSSVSYQSGLSMVSEKNKTCIQRLKEQLEFLDENNRGIIYCINGMYPSAEIAEIAEREEIDVIVMALRQKYSLIDKMIGSTTAHTIQKSTIPVLAIPSGSL